MASAIVAIVSSVMRLARAAAFASWRSVALACVTLGLVAPTAGALVGGTPTSVASAPWAVYLGISDGASCSGSILDSRHVLTAAHCLFTGEGVLVKPSQVEVIAGVSNSVRPLPGESAQVRLASRLFVYPGYGPPTFEFPQGVDEDADIAVVQFATPLELGSDVQGLSLPAVSHAHPFGAGLVLAGFGRERRSLPPNGELRAASFDVPETTKVSCCVWADRVAPCTSTAYLFCGSSPSAAACFGDSGAGLVRGNTVLGVANIGDCSRGQSALFVDVSAPLIRQFIQDGLLGRQDAASPRAAPTAPGWLTYREYSMTFAAPKDYYVTLYSGQLELEDTTGVITLFPLPQLFPKGIRVMNTPSNWSEMETEALQRVEANLTRDYADVRITDRLTTLNGQRALKIDATFITQNGGHATKATLISFTFIEGWQAVCLGDKVVTEENTRGEHPCTAYVPAQLNLTGSMTSANESTFARVIASIRFSEKPSLSPAVACLEGDGCPVSAR